MYIGKLSKKEVRKDAEYPQEDFDPQLDIRKGTFLSPPEEGKIFIISTGVLSYTRTSQVQSPATLKKNEWGGRLQTFSTVNSIYELEYCKEADKDWKEKTMKKNKRKELW